MTTNRSDSPGGARKDVHAYGPQLDSCAGTEGRRERVEPDTRTSRHQVL